MIIERAIEKLREANGGKLPRDYPAHAGAHSTATAAAPPPVMRKEQRAPQQAPRANVTSISAIPRLICDREVATKYRIMLPETDLAANERIAASYRMIRTRLLHRMRSNNWTSVAVTSPEAGEGKSITAMNLALNLARDGTSNVFLIDLDMRNPTICRSLGVQPPTELISYFLGESTPESVFFSIGADNLAIAGNVTTTDIASDLLSGNSLDQLIAYIRTVSPNPLIIVDLPPVLVTDEALLVAPRVDSTLLVVAEGKTRRDSLLKARQVLADFPSAGVVLNKSSENVGGGGYYYHYGQAESKS